MIPLRKKRSPIDAGRFNRQLTIENEVNVDDGLGGLSKTFQAEVSVWAHICPVGSALAYKADHPVHEITHRIFLRFHASVGPATRFVTGTRRFYVVHLRDPDETGRYLECEVTERV